MARIDKRHTAKSKCKHRQGFWHKKYDVVYLRCRGCKSVIEVKVPLVWPKGAAGEAAQLQPGQAKLPEPVIPFATTS